MVDSYIHLSIIFSKAYEYRVSQKFVPLNSCTIILIKTSFLHETAGRCLFLYLVHVFRISVTGIPILFCFFFYHIL